jgi:hypothetical protein
MALGSVHILTKSWFPAFTKCMADPRRIQTRQHFCVATTAVPSRPEFIKNRTHPAMGRVMGVI